jgi:hypothetical protein
VLAPAETFEGVWNLKYRAEVCEGERHCFAVKGQTYDFSVRLVRAGLGYDGVVLLGANVDVTGTVDSTGALVLSGIQHPAVDHSSVREIEIRRLRLTREAGVFGGDLDLVTRGEWTGWMGTESRRTGPLVSAVKVGDITPASSRSFAGTWAGRVATRDCSFVGWQACYPLEQRELWNFQLTLTESGGRVTGLLTDPRDAAIDGTVAGGTIVVQGAGDDRNNSGLTNVITTVRPSTFTRDEVGRLKGSLSLEIRWLWKDGRVSSTDFRVIELIDVVLRPPS